MPIGQFNKHASQRGQDWKTTQEARSKQLKEITTQIGERVEKMKNTLNAIKANAENKIDGMIGSGQAETGPDFGERLAKVGGFIGAPENEVQALYKK